MRLTATLLLVTLSLAVHAPAGDDMAAAAEREAARRKANAKKDVKTYSTEHNDVGTNHAPDAPRPATPPQGSSTGRPAPVPQGPKGAATPPTTIAPMPEGQIYDPFGANPNDCNNPPKGAKLEVYNAYMEGCRAREAERQRKLRENAQRDWEQKQKAEQQKKQ